jgi:hypothetical protein
MSANLLCVKVKVKAKGQSVWIPPVPIALFVLRDAIISFDGYLGLIPGSLGTRVRGGADAIQALLFALTQSTLDVDVDVKDKGNAVKVRVWTL